MLTVYGALLVNLLFDGRISEYLLNIFGCVIKVLLTKLVWDLTGGILSLCLFLYMYMDLTVLDPYFQDLRLIFSK